MPSISFSETQKFKQVWLWLVIIAVIALEVIENGSLFFHSHKTNEPGLIVVGIFAFVVPLLVALLLAVFRLETKIDETGIYYRFFPYHKKMNKIEWDNVGQIFIRKYRPLMEYGGWGVKWGLSGRAYNVSGNMGIQIVYKDGKKLLLGTKQPEEASNIIAELTKAGIIKDENNSTMTVKDRF